jgi:aminoglycoside phosphotransferase family enzyme/gluconate kinase
MQNQTLIENMLNPDVYAHETHDIRLVETHCAWVVLTGGFVYKIKKPVDFGFLDFSTLQKRQHFCEEEVRLNRRFAPDIYLDVVTITGTAAHPELSGQGEVLEYAVRMRQFPDNVLLSDLSASNRLQTWHIDQLVLCIAKFHEQAGCAQAADRFGDPPDIQHWVRENYQHIRPLLRTVDDHARLEKVRLWSEDEYRQLAPLLGRRKSDGAVRECHGDLHLGNITLIDGRVTPFDCIEFNPQLRWIDVISEVAFLLMDLDGCGRSGFGWRFLNGYLQYGGDYTGLRVLRYYLVYRAMVRAKVAVLRRQQLVEVEDAFSRATDEYLQYLHLAETYLSSGPVSLVITHGLSGSGKSTIARELGERMGFIQLRSDVERKRLAGLGSRDSSRSGTGTGLYTADRTSMTYHRLSELTEAVLRSGYSVIVDATFLKREYRNHFRGLAEKLDAPFLVLDCDAEEQELERRILSRAASQSDASEATLDVLRAQKRSHEPLADSENHYVLRVDTGQMDMDEVEVALKHRIGKFPAV